MAYRIVTDTGCDFPQPMYEEKGLVVVPLTVNYKGTEYTTYTESWLQEMYEGLRAGESASTSAVNPDGWAKAIAPILEAGEDALVLTFSSGLSTTHQSAVIAAQELMDTYPGRTVNVVDTRCASLGQGLLVHYACQKRDAGLTLEELTAWCENHKLNLCHWFTVDDLFFLKRGGRVSAATAVVGTMLGIKPVMHVDNAGKLIKVTTARGRKASIDALFDRMKETVFPKKDGCETVFISHGDCEEDALYLADRIRTELGYSHIEINFIGPVIGAHSGPGTLALFFLGSER